MEFGSKFPWLYLAKLSNLVSTDEVIAKTKRLVYEKQYSLLELRYIFTT